MCVTVESFLSHQIILLSIWLRRSTAVSSFNFQVTSSSRNPVSIALFVNPAGILNNQTLYTRMFPLAWKICKFPGGSKEHQGVLTVNFDATNSRACLGEAKVNNTVSAASLATITADAYNFTVGSVEAGPLQLITDTTTGSMPLPPKGATIQNLTAAARFIGIADVYGAPYVGIDTNPDPSAPLTTANFTWTSGYTFAVVVVNDPASESGGTVEAGKIYSEGTTAHPFITFNGNDVQKGCAAVTWNGAHLSVGVPNFVICPSSQRIFESGVRSCCFSLY